MAPLHHHFELSGRMKIMLSLDSIIGILLALFSLTTLNFNKMIKNIKNKKITIFGYGESDKLQQN